MALAVVLMKSEQVIVTTEQQTFRMASMKKDVYGKFTRYVKVYIIYIVKNY